DLTSIPTFKPAPLRKSTDNGANWNLDTTGLSKVTGHIFFIDETGNQHYSSTYFGGSYLSLTWMRSPGGTWSADSVGLPAYKSSYFTAMGSDMKGSLYISGYIAGAINHNMIYRRPV